MAQFAFEMVSPEQRLISEEVDSVIVPGTEGEFTILAGHAPFMSTVRSGVVTVQSGSTARKIMVYGGFAEAGPEGFTLLAERAIDLAEVNRAEIDKQIVALKEDLSVAKDDTAKALVKAKLLELQDLQAAL
jgi:F-type H+-transporting ATPase subunit epsilon